MQGMAEGLVIGQRLRVVGHHLTDRRGVGIEAGGKHAESGVPFGEDAGEHAMLGDEGSAAVQVLHHAGDFAHRLEDRDADEGTLGENLMDRTAGHDLSPDALVERHSYQSFNRASFGTLCRNPTAGAKHLF